ncbi:MAG: hydrogenase 2 operon protein HybA [Syntrophales bacterium]|nr:hydrogenase 2 operon protein HybA [Syntrophales bacterium]MDD5640385.1 hydrogenase 2 operon protein HybA [Syntrophales bacterium]
MGLSRRDFLKVAAGGSLVAASSFSPAPLLARESKARLPEAVGILYDATVCIGCKACMAACKEYNHLPPDHSTPGSVWDNPLDLSAKTYNIVKLYKNGTGQTKDQAINGYSFIRRFCMHCVDPACVSACPVSALTKDSTTGVVKYDKGACIGCRYCQIACPYNVPKFQWDQAFPQIKKCQLCDHRIAQGGYSACCEFCPNGASIFGNVQDLRKEARRRLALKPGEVAHYPLHRVDSQDVRHRIVTPYLNHIFGEREGGGTQVLMLANVPFQDLGLPPLPDESAASQSETLMHSLYKGMIAPYVLLGGLFYLVYKNTTKQDLP